MFVSRRLSWTPGLIVVNTMRRPRTQFARMQFCWRALGASIAVTLVVASNATSMLLAPSQSDLIRSGIIEVHIRSLMAPRPIDVASSDATR